MAGRRVVPPLLDLCFEAFYTDFYRDLLFKATPNTVEFVRRFIYEPTMGIMSSTFRQKCLKDLNDCWFMDENQGEFHEEEPFIILDVCTILDCILDEGFEDELYIVIPYATMKFFPTIMSIIARRSPELRKLHVRFVRTFAERTAMELEAEPELLELQNCCLTNVTLSFERKHIHSCRGQGNLHGPCEEFLTPPESESILSVVADRCPVLTDLCVDGLIITNRDILGLMLGEKNRIVFPIDKQWSLDSAGLQIPSQFLSQLCSTLQVLSLIWEPSLVTFRSEEYLSFKLALTLAARHLLKLQFLNSSRTLDVINIIHEKQYFLSTGFLSLTSLEMVFIEDEEMLRTIGSLCPCLENVGFSGSKIHFPRRGHNNILDYPPSQEDIESILNGWPKLKSITLSGSFIRSDGVDHVKPILKAFGSGLKKLLVFSYHPVDLLDLIPCTKLEYLTFMECSFKPRGNAVDWNPDTFLPCLKSFISTSSHCLESWAPLFERKETLTELRLNCCHIQTPGYFPGVTWAQVSELWQQLERLELRQCNGLTMEVLSKLLPKLPKLQHLILPVDTIPSKEIVQRFSKIKFIPKTTQDNFLVVFSLKKCLLQRK